MNTSRKKIIKVFAAVYLLTSFSWLLGPVLNHHFAVGPNLISEYESIGAPYAMFFRVFDVIAALSLFGAAYAARKDIKRQYGKVVIYAVIAIATLSIIDIVTAPHCEIIKYICQPQNGLVLNIHFIESTLLGIVFFIIGVYVSLRHKKYAWGPVLQALFGLSGIAASRHYTHAQFALQSLTIIMQTFWLWKVLFERYYDDEKNLSDIGLVRRSLGLVVGLSGFLTVVTSTRFGFFNTHTRIWFGPATAWAAQHNILAGIVLLYLARKIYQGEVVAYRIVLLILGLQIIKFSAVDPQFMPLITYAAIAVLLIFSRSYFIRHSRPQRAITRIRYAATAVLVSLLLAIVVSVAFEVREPSEWRQSAYSVGRIAMRVSLLEITTNKNEKLTSQLFGQLLTALGIGTYAWVLAGLFAPALYSKIHASDAEREQMRDLIDQYGTNSEDSFKLWPEDKRYWFSKNLKAGIAFKQYKSYVFALGSPVGEPRDIKLAMHHFRMHCARHGWKIVWLMTDTKAADQLTKYGFKSMTIGASAVVTLIDFADTTVRDKWWRWNRNKNAKLGLQYQELEESLSAVELNQLGEVSQQWLGKHGHEERTFALGFYDEAFLANCRVHVLRDTNNRIVAFCNQLPSYHGNTQATIDLMRSLPEYDGAVSYLLSEVLLALHNEGLYKTFDLGFVPLAHSEQTVGKKTTLAIGKILFQAFFSARGLRQFKNKFDPDWHENFLVWDGDLLDLPSIAQAMDKVLTLKTNNNSPKFESK